MTLAPSSTAEVPANQTPPTRLSGSTDQNDDFAVVRTASSDLQSLKVIERDVEHSPSDYTYTTNALGAGLLGKKFKTAAILYSGALLCLVDIGSGAATLRRFSSPGSWGFRRINIEPPTWLGPGVTAPVLLVPATRNSTDERLGVATLVEATLKTLVACPVEEESEEGEIDGTSHLSQGLSALLADYGDAAIAAIHKLVVDPSSNVGIVVEVAQWVGEASDPASLEERREILEGLLKAATPRIRHGAATGLAAIDDPRSVPALRRALERESSRRVKDYLLLVLEQVQPALA